MVIALYALGHIVGDGPLLQHFCRESGLDASDLKPLAGFLGGVLDFMLAEETRLLAFCEAACIAPDEPANARRALPGSSHEALT